MFFSKEFLAQFPTSEHSILNRLAMCTDDEGVSFVDPLTDKTMVRITVEELALGTNTWDLFLERYPLHTSAYDLLQELQVR